MTTFTKILKTAGDFGKQISKIAEWQQLAIYLLLFSKILFSKSLTVDFFKNFPIENYYIYSIQDSYVTNL